jgi:7,8-dihydro-6-hydroxymethylpterin-pyrophosphokinase
LRKIQVHVGKLIRHHGFPVVHCDNYLNGCALLRTHLQLKETK